LNIGKSAIALSDPIYLFKTQPELSKEKQKEERKDIRQRSLVRIMERPQLNLIQLPHNLLPRILTQFLLTQLGSHRIPLRDLREQSGEVGTLLRGYLGCGRVRCCCTVADGKDGSVGTIYSEVGYQENSENKKPREVGVLPSTVMPRLLVCALGNFDIKSFVN
jgi:hypothetical protein